MKKNLASLLMSFLLIIIMIGCSSQNPMTPNGQDTSSNLSSHLFTITERDSENSSLEASGLMGAYNLSIDTETQSVELNPIRITASQDVIEVVDITNFLSLAPCTDCVQVSGVSLNENNNLVLKIGIKHPFGKANPSLPISGRNRADLHVFNVEGTVVLKDAVTSVVTFPTINKISTPPILVNADGYSQYLDSPLDSVMMTVSNLHPYILHFDDFTPGNFNPISENGFTDVFNPSGNLVMAMGSPMDYQDYEFDLSGMSGIVQLIYAVGCTYGISADSRDQRLTPVYRIPQFNKKAASVAYVDEIIQDNGKGFEPGIASSSETIILKMLDMNYGATIGEGLDQMRRTSNIYQIDIEIPNVINGKKTFLNPTPISGNPRSVSNPLTFSFKLYNEKAAPQGEYFCLIRILDTYPTGRNTSIPGDAIGRVDPTQIPTEGLYTLNEFATYVVKEITVENLNIEPQACFIFRPVNNAKVGLPIKFDATCSEDSDGNILTYHWDFDYQHPDFTIDAIGPIVYHPFDTIDNHIVALKVYDDGFTPKSNMVADQVFVIETNPLVFGENKNLISNVDYQNSPWGSHYADSKDNLVYAICLSESQDNLNVIRSDDSGDTFVTPAVYCNDAPIVTSGFLEGPSLKITDSNRVDTAWNISFIPGTIHHDYADSNYNFGFDQLVTGICNFNINFSHDVAGEDYVFLSLSYYQGSTIRAALIVSSDGGGSWGTPRNVPNLSGSGVNGTFVDSVIAVDDNGTIHCLYVGGQDTTSRGQIRYTKSTNYGSTFSTYVPVTTIPNYTEYNNFLSLDTSTDGQYIYIAYRSDTTNSKINFVRSTDSGANFETPITIDDVTSKCDHPCVVADDYGWVYVTFEDRVSEVVPMNYDIRIVRSKDYGETWEPSVRVDDDTSDAMATMPTVSVDEELNVHVFWRDDRDAIGTNYALYYAKGK